PMRTPMPMPMPMPMPTPVPTPVPTPTPTPVPTPTRNPMPAPMPTTRATAPTPDATSGDVDQARVDRARASDLAVVAQELGEHRARVVEIEQLLLAAARCIDEEVPHRPRIDRHRIDTGDHRLRL